MYIWRASIYICTLADTVALAQQFIIDMSDGAISQRWLWKDRYMHKDLISHAMGCNCHQCAIVGRSEQCRFHH